MKYIFVVICTCSIALSCQSPIKTGVLKSSFNISESKKNGVFIAKYIPSIPTIDVENKVIEIDQIWIEYFWEYKNQNKEILKKSTYHGLVKLKNDVDIFDIKISVNGIENGITGRKLSFPCAEIKDTLIVLFQGDKEITMSFVKK